METEDQNLPSLLHSFNVKISDKETAHINHFSTDLDQEPLDEALYNPKFLYDDEIETKFEWKNVDGGKVDAPEIIKIKKGMVRDFSSTPRCKSTKTKSGRPCQQFVKTDGMQCRWHFEV